MITAYVLIGPPGCGKSTFGERLAEKENASIFSADAKRQEVLGDVSDQSQNKSIWEMVFDDAQTALRAGSSVIVDGVHSVRSSRAKAIRLCREAGAERVVAIAFTTPEKVCIARRSPESGNRVVPASEVTRHYNNLKDGISTCFEGEGFDLVKIESGS